MLWGWGCTTPVSPPVPCSVLWTHSQVPAPSPGLPQLQHNLVPHRVPPAPTLQAPWPRSSLSKQQALHRVARSSFFSANNCVFLSMQP